MRGTSRPVGSRQSHAVEADGGSNGLTVARGRLEDEAPHRVERGAGKWLFPGGDLNAADAAVNLAVTVKSMTASPAAPAGYAASGADVRCGGTMLGSEALGGTAVVPGAGASCGSVASAANAVLSSQRLGPKPNSRDRAPLHLPGALP